jgi:hypothetical protein
MEITDDGMAATRWTAGFGLSSMLDPAIGLCGRILLARRPSPMIRNVGS